MNNCLKLFLEIERNNKAFNREHKGTPYWQLIRSWVYTCIDKESKNFDNLKEKRGGVSTVLKKIFVILTNCFLHIPQIFCKKYMCDILFSAPYDYRLVMGKKRDIFIDYLNIDKCYKCYKYEYNNLANISKGHKIISSCYADFKMIFSYGILKKLKKNKLNEKERNFVETITREINEQFKTNIDWQQVVERIEYSVAVNNTYYKTIKKYLKKIKPKLIIVVDAFGIRNYATIRAAKELTIKVAELQHGVIGSSHVDYNYMEKIVSQYYFSDYLLTFGDYWNKSLELPRNCNKISIGYSFIDYVVSINQKSKREEETLVFYSNTENEWANFVLLCAGEAFKNGYKVIFKYHPLECGKNEYKQLYNTGIEIIDTPTETHSLILKYEHHVSIASTVLFEAVMQGASAYVYNVKGSEYLKDMVEEGCATLFNDEKDLIHAIQTAKTEKKSEVIKSLRKDNASKNINEIIKNILGE